MTEPTTAAEFLPTVDRDLIAEHDRIVGAEAVADALERRLEREISQAIEDYLNSSEFEEQLAEALHHYWHTDDTWGMHTTREEDMAIHRHNAEGIICALQMKKKS